MAQTSLRYQARAKGGPMELVSVPRPQIEGPNDVQINLKAVSMQPIDWVQRDLGLRVESYPYVGGMNGAGVISDVGSDVSNFKVGDAVLGLFMWGGQKTSAFQEYAVLNDKTIAKKPEDMTWEEAASLPIPYVTGAAAIYRGTSIEIPFLPKLDTPLRPKSVLLLGGSSSVGAVALQLARLSLGGDAMIVTTCSKKHHERVIKTLGADHAFDRDASVESIRAVSPSASGFDVIVACVDTLYERPELFELLQPDGPKRVAEVASTNNVKNIPEGINYTLSNGFQMFGVGNVWDGLVDAWAKKQFTLPIPIEVIGESWDAINVGMDRLKNKEVSGTKLVIRV